MPRKTFAPTTTRFENSLSPQEIHDCLQDPSSAETIAYLESCHVGEFFCGPIDEMRTKVLLSNTRANGLHGIITEEVCDPVPGYVDPTLTLPEAPPTGCDDAGCHGCDNCTELLWKFPVGKPKEDK